MHGDEQSHGVQFVDVKRIAELERHLAGWADGWVEMDGWMVRCTYTDSWLP